MTKRKREILALTLLIVLIVGVLFALVLYMTSGHNWNVAATHIDDVTGTMDDYVVLVYEGTIDDGTSSRTTSSKDLTSAQPGNPDGLSTQSQPGKADDLSTSPQPGNPDGLSTQSQSGNPDESDVSDAASTSNTSETTVPKAADRSSFLRPTLEEVEKSYKDKGATVFQLDTLAPERYRDSLVVMKNACRVGILYIDAKDSSITIDKNLFALKNKNPDIIVVVTNAIFEPFYLYENDATNDQSADGVKTSASSHGQKPSPLYNEYLMNVNGVDIIISTTDLHAFLSGTTMNDRFCIRTPSLGSIGVILVSPNSVVSSKVIGPTTQ